MGRYRVTERMLAQLTYEDLSALRSVYRHRCLNEPLLYQNVYQRLDIRRSFCQGRIQWMIGQGFLEAVEYGAEFPALFISTLGLEVIKTKFAAELRAGYREGDGEDKLPLARDIRIRENNIAHQMALNQFSLEFERYAQGNVYYRYYDGKFMTPVSNFMMPDGMIELSSCYLFLEMDMGTERPSYLARKWNSYRGFLHSSAFLDGEKPVVMAFILDGIANVSLRKKNIIASIMIHLAELLDGQNSHFDILIGTPEELHEVIKTQLLMLHTDLGYELSCISGTLTSQFGFRLTRPSWFEKMSYPCDGYARKLNEARKVIVIDGRPQEVLVDYWLDGRLSVLRNILFMGMMEKEVASLVGRTIPYLVVVPSERWAFEMLQAIGGEPQSQYLLFTTPERLATRDWPEAIFVLDGLGNLLHHTSASLSLTSLAHEKRIPRYERRRRSDDRT